MDMLHPDRRPSERPSERPSSDQRRESVVIDDSNDNEGASAPRHSPLTSRLLSSLSDRGSHRSSSPLRDEWHVEEPSTHYGPKRRPWHARPKSPKLGWYKEYNEKNVKYGRVLVIDYVKGELSQEGMRKVASQEINNLEGLEKLYANPSRRDEAILRLFHVQNAHWAVHFLLKKLWIKSDDLVGSTFGQYATYTRPERLRGKPLLKGRSWPLQHDPWRGISKTAFGIDYLKMYKAGDKLSQSQEADMGKFMELNCYDENTDEPRYGYDIYPQRLSCYIQRHEATSDLPSDPEIRSPYEDRHKNPEELDNGNVIVIFENSKTCKITDTLISARESWESRWRRLPFYLAFESHEIDGNDDLALQCMRMIIEDIWSCLGESWDNLLDVADHHVAILEEKIYEQPADETRADEIWLNSSNWLKVERLVYTHINILQQLNNNVRELVADSREEWLEAPTQSFQRLRERVEENLTKPTNNLSDLMYKSVEIRDSRHSLELSLSMWRMSWVTFLFLPLTFTVGFFGMNVDTFANDPEIKWYFIAAIPMMVLVVILYFFFKHRFAQARQTPYSRGIYERFFHDLASDYPLLWTRTGPRDNVKPRGRMRNVQWSLIQSWNQPKKTIRNPIDKERDPFDGLGTVSGFQRSLTRRWTSDMNKAARILRDPETPEEPQMEKTGGIVEDLAKVMNVAGATNGSPVGPGLAVGSAIANVPNDLNQRLNQDIDPAIGQAALQRLSVASSGSRRRSSQGSSPGRNSGIIVEEQRPDWLYRKD